MNSIKVFLSFLFLSLLLHFSLIPSFVSALGTSLSDCQEIAAKFNNTCDTSQGAATSVSAMSGTQVSCTLSSSTACPGTYSSGVCTFNHKLCVTCSNSTGTTRIRVQSNGLSPRCYNTPAAVTEMNFDFETNFNPAVSSSTQLQSPTTQSEVNAIVCNIQQHASVPSASSFTNIGTSSLNTHVGIAIDGVSMLNPNSANNVDPFFPTSSYSAEMVDNCLDHPQGQGILHYHSMSGCQLTYPTGSISPCSSDPTCSGSNIKTKMLSGFSNYQTLTVIGIAKDGHIIYGPYDSEGNLVTSGHDVCNGVFFDSALNYAYFATNTFPYLSACFGPGNYPSFTPTCTTNGPSGYTPSSFITANSASSSCSISSISVLVMILAVLVCIF